MPLGTLLSYLYNFLERHSFLILQYVPDQRITLFICSWSGATDSYVSPERVFWGRTPSPWAWSHDPWTMNKSHSNKQEVKCWINTLMVNTWSKNQILGRIRCNSRPAETTTLEPIARPIGHPLAANEKQTKPTPRKEKTTRGVQPLFLWRQVRPKQRRCSWFALRTVTRALIYISRLKGAGGLWWWIRLPCFLRLLQDIAGLVHSGNNFIRFRLRATNHRFYRGTWK